MFKNVKSTFLVVLTLSLGGCGGGGSDGGSGGDGDVVNNSSLSKYTGSWSHCYGYGNYETFTISSSQNGSLNINMKSDYYSGDNCTGEIVANQTYTFSINIVSAGVESAVVALPPSGLTSRLDLDLIEVSTNGGSISVIGDGVSHIFKNGQWQYCFDRNPSSQTCVLDEVISAESSAGALYTDGVNLYQFMKYGAAWTAASDTYLKN